MLVKVPYRKMAYGEVTRFDCPLPLKNFVEITCFGLNALTVDGMCIGPCNPGRITYRDGATRISHPMMPRNERIECACPLNPASEIVEIVISMPGSISILIFLLLSP